MWKKIERFLLLGQEWFMLISISVVTIAAFLQVLFRYVFHIPQPGLEEIARYLMVTLTFIGVGLAVEKKAHIRLDLLLHLFAKNKRFVSFIETLNQILGVMFGAFMTFLGYELLIFAIQANQHSIGANLPLAWFKASIMVGFALMTLYYTAALVRWKNSKKGIRSEG